MIRHFQPLNDIVLVELMLHLEPKGSWNRNHGVSFGRVTGPWTESALTWNNAPSYTNTSSEPAGPAAGGWYSLDITPQVTDWLDGTASNHGIAIYPNSSNKESNRLCSRECPIATQAPYVRVTYEESSTAPEATTYLNEYEATTVYEYDALDRLTKIVDAEGNERAFTYDQLGRQLTAELPHVAGEAAATHAFIYDAVGNVTSETHPNGDVVTYTYDDLNRRLTADGSTESGVEVTYQYDTATNGIGQLTSVTGPDFSKDFTYDAAGNAATETLTHDATSHTTTRTYSDHGLLASVTHPDGTTVTNTYHRTGDIDTVSEGGSQVVDVAYNHLGQITSQNFQNGVSETYTYSPALEFRLAGKTVTNGTDTHLDLAYTYDPVGNVTGIENTGTTLPYTKEYRYDSLDRLIISTSTASGGELVDTFTYSPTGNLLTKSGITYAYDNQTFPQAVTQYSLNTYSYDQNGNLATATRGGDTHTYTYDWNDRLATVQSGLNTVSTFTYTDTRQRLTKAAGYQYNLIHHRRTRTERPTRNSRLPNLPLRWPKPRGSYRRHRHHLQPSRPPPVWCA